MATQSRNSRRIERHAFRGVVAVRNPSHGTGRRRGIAKLRPKSSARTGLAEGHRAGTVMTLTGLGHRLISGGRVTAAAAWFDQAGPFLAVANGAVVTAGRAVGLDQAGEQR